MHPSWHACRTVRTVDELERLWKASAAPAATRGPVQLLVARLGGGKHRELERAELSSECGLRGDRWIHGANAELGRQLTLMNATVAALVCDGLPLHLPGDNVLVDLDLSEDTTPVGTRIRLGTSLIEVTDKPHLGCKKFQARFGDGAMRWVNAVSGRVRRLRGVNARVIEDGEVAVGDLAERLP